MIRREDARFKKRAEMKSPEVIKIIDSLNEGKKNKNIKLSPEALL